MLNELVSRVHALAHELNRLWETKRHAQHNDLNKLAYREHELLRLVSEGLSLLRGVPLCSNGGCGETAWLVTYDFLGCRTPRHFYRILHRLKHVRYVSRSCVLVWDENDLARLLDALRRYHARFVCFRVVEEVEL